MNPIIEYMYECRNGNYCHALECYSVHDLIYTIEAFMMNDHHSSMFIKSDFIEFFKTIELYHLRDDELSDDDNDTLESELFNFNIEQFIDDLNF